MKVQKCPKYKKIIKSNLRRVGYFIPYSCIIYKKNCVYERFINYELGNYKKIIVLLFWPQDGRKQISDFLLSNLKICAWFTQRDTKFYHYNLIVKNLKHFKTQNLKIEGDATRRDIRKYLKVFFWNLANFTLVVFEISRNN